VIPVRTLDSQPSPEAQLHVAEIGTIDGGGGQVVLGNAVPVTGVRGDVVTVNVVAGKTAVGITVGAGWPAVRPFASRYGPARIGTEVPEIRCRRVCRPHAKKVVIVAGSHGAGVVHTQFPMTGGGIVESPAGPDVVERGVHTECLVDLSGAAGIIDPVSGGGIPGATTLTVVRAAGVGIEDVDAHLAEARRHFNPERIVRVQAAGAGADVVAEAAGAAGADVRGPVIRPVAAGRQESRQHQNRSEQYQETFRSNSSAGVCFGCGGVHGSSSRLLTFYSQKTFLNY